MVWISTAPADPSNFKSLVHRFWKNDTTQEAGLREITAKIKRGEALTADEFPSEIFGAPDAKESDYKLPDLFYAYGFWVVTKAAADVLRQFELGGGGLHPVKMFKKDRVTPIEGEFLCINFGNRKQGLLPEHSLGLRKAAGSPQWRMPFVTKDGDIALSSGVLTGPDIWIDPLARSSIFFSDGLGKALKKAKASKGFSLKKCRII